MTSKVMEGHFMFESPLCPQNLFCLISNLSKPHMNATIMNILFFPEMKYDLYV